MTTIKTIALDEATGPAKDILSGIKKKVGMVPNIYAAMAQSTATLDAYLAFSGGLSKGELSPALREQIALTVAGQNSCDYCASAHTALAKMAGVSADEARRAVSGKSSDERIAVALRFASDIVENRGFVADELVEEVRAAGYSDTEIVEIIANVCANIFTNYFNHIAGTEIDFPVVSTEEVLSAA